LGYEEFIDLAHRPGESELICDFQVQVEEGRLRWAAGGVAAESSIGTWTELKTLKGYVERLRARVFEIKGRRIRIAYPSELFEPGNLPNILSSVAGNIFGLRGINVRLVDIHLPRELIKTFKGPKYGVEGVRKTLGVEERPLLGTIIKPKLGLNPEDHARIAYESWAGGCDIVKDDENLASQGFNPFEERLAKTLEARDRAEEETGEKKAYLINITAESREMLRRAELVERSGGRYVMLDVLTAGFSALQTLRNQELKLIIHGHRAGHAAVTKNRRHGIAMPVIAKLARLAGVDQLHVGAGVGKMTEDKGEVRRNISALKEEMNGVGKTMPVASGGLHPALVPELLELFGRDFVCQAGGGVHGHPGGTTQGAIAMRQALEAALHRVSLDEYAREHIELQTALEKWRRRRR